MRVVDNGYGTQVAGITAGKAYGIAESAQVCSVKVFSSEKAGLNVTVTDGGAGVGGEGWRKAREGGGTGVLRRVISMSLSSGLLLAVKNATEGAVLASSSSQVTAT